MIFYPVMIAVIIGCSVHETNCGLKEPEKREYYSESVLSEKGIIPVYVDGYQYVPVDYLKAVRIGNEIGPLEPFWTTRNYGVYPTHNYPYNEDATVYYSVEANQFGVLSEDLNLEIQGMKTYSLD